MADSKARARALLATLRVPIVVAVAAWSVWLLYRLKLVWFVLHPLMMLLAFSGLAPVAVLFKKVGGLQNTNMHGNLMAGALLAGLFGWYVIYTNKTKLGKEHNTSWHGQLGVAVMLGWAALSFAGFAFLSPSFGLLKTSKLIRAVHKYVGKALMILAALVSFLGWYTLGFNKSYTAILVFAAPTAIITFFAAIE